MALPFFYKEDISTASKEVILDEATSKHIVQVLRMQKGEQVQLTNGKGHLFTCAITDDNRKKCAVKINASQLVNAPAKKVSIAISPLKNANRFEWFLEKATELGVTKIIPLVCKRTEKDQLKEERMKGILVSALLQSQQAWLPEMQAPVKFEQWLRKSTPNKQSFIAHCLEDDSKKNLVDAIDNSSAEKIILIGPEGDFTKEEIDAALAAGYIPVSLGNTRLRTETAAITAAVLLCQI
ncbi:MAG: RsmE family RNA methyltransferase [Chitinophagaceae bacterium]